MTTIREKVAPAWFDIGDSKFLIAPLSPYDAIDFRNEISFHRGKIRITGEGIRIAGNAVRDWQNVLADETKEPIKFSRDRYDDLDLPVLEKIAVKVFSQTFLAEIERKNSSSPSTSG